jgi:Ca2+-binding RTX toxin-like protein
MAHLLNYATNGIWSWRMAKVDYFENLADFSSFNAWTYDNLALASNASATHAGYTDSSTGAKIIIEGDSLGYVQSAITAGSITSVTLADQQGDALITYSNLDASGSDWNDIFAESGFSGMIQYLQRGNDQVTGSTVGEALDGWDGKDVLRGDGGDDYLLGLAGNDRLFGGEGNDRLYGYDGNDRMTGDAGSDIFVFSGVTGKDVIADFDARGGGDKQDHLDIRSSETFSISKGNGDVTISFGDGDSLLLLDAARGFDAQDITLS